MADVRIVTDSACDLPPGLAQQFGIDVVPLTIRFGANEYVDRVDLGVGQFYDKMAASDLLPETAAPSPGAFGEAFERAFSDGAEAVLCINLSAQLSATMQSAVTAATAMGTNHPASRIEVIDSQSITMGLGTLVLQAARAAAEGASLEDLVALVHELRNRTRVVGILDTLENLKKGGRIGGAKALLGSVLAIKPMVDITSGAVEEAGKHRTRRRSVQALAERVAADGAIEHLAVMHANAPDIDDMLDALTSATGISDPYVDLIGPVIATHAGPGTIGCCWVVPA